MDTDLQARSNSCTSGAKSFPFRPRGARESAVFSFWAVTSAVAVLVGIAAIFSATKPPFGDFSVIILECELGTDKNPATGHRTDTKYLLEELHSRGIFAEVWFFRDANAVDLYEQVINAGFGAFVSRVDPGEYPYCTSKGYYAFLRRLADGGLAAFNHPDEMERMGSKAALLNLEGLPLSQNDTHLYDSFTEFSDHFPYTLLWSDRVIKQNRGSKGEGIWRVQVDRQRLARQYWTARARKESRRSTHKRQWARRRGAKRPRSASRRLDRAAASPIELTPGTPLVVTEAKDNSQRTMTLADFIDFCRPYLDGDDGLVVNQAYLSRIAEGEIRVIMTGRRPVYVVDRRPGGANGNSSASANALQPQSPSPGSLSSPAALNATAVDELLSDGHTHAYFPAAAVPFSANLGASARHTYMPPEAMPELVAHFVAHLPDVLVRMNVTTPPLLWTVDFIRTGPAHATEFVISEINCSCVGFSAHPELASDIVDAVVAEYVRQRAGRGAT